MEPHRFATAVRHVLAVVAIVGMSIASPAYGQISSTSTLQWSAVDQNMWGPGNASTVDWSHFFGATWFDGLSAGAMDNTLGIRDGAEVSLFTDGTIGVSLNARMTGGSVDVQYAGQAGVGVASELINPGEVFTLSTSFLANPSQSSLATEFPNFQAWAEFKFGVYARADFEVCALDQCYGDGATVFNVTDGSHTDPCAFEFIGICIPGTVHDPYVVPLASINKDGDGRLLVLGQDQPIAGITLGEENDINGIKLTVNLPNLETASTGLSGGDLASSGAVDVLSVGGDVPRAVLDYIVPGGGYLLSGDICCGFSYSVFSSSIGATFGIAQNFLFDASPMVSLVFNQPVQQVVRGVVQDPTTTLNVRLGQNVDLLGTPVDLAVTPFYFLNGVFHAETDATAAVDASVEFLSLDIPNGIPLLPNSLGPVFADDFSSPTYSLTVDDRQFAMQFASFEGGTLFLSATPEPATILMLGSGLVSLAAAAGRRRKKYIDVA